MNQKLMVVGMIAEERLPTVVLEFIDNISSASIRAGQ
jgi:hypothetical protein